MTRTSPASDPARPLPGFLRRAALLTLAPLAAASCADAGGTEGRAPDAAGDAGRAPAGDARAARAASAVECDPDDAGLALPEGFCALAVAEDVGRARHLVVAENGDVFVALRGERGGGGGGVVALRDTDDDGRADVEERFFEDGGTGISLHGGYLYFAPDWGVVRWPWSEGRLAPDAPADTVVRGLPGPGTSHAAKTAVIDEAGNLFVNIGSPSNACQEQQRSAGSPGQDPCPQLETRAGIWRFDADGNGQTQEEGDRFATGLRNTFALAVHPETGRLYGVQHGRDQLAQLWPDLYTSVEGAEKPAEEMVAIDEGDDFGWPYCYYDPQKGEKVLAPEYGGDGEEVGRCAEAEDPVVAFPGHWGPNGLAFYTGSQFPERYRGGAFVAFHGSWNRAPEPQAGYNVTFVPFEGGSPTGDYEVFAEGFPGGQVNPRDAEHRPSGVAVGPDGSLYVADDSGGTIFRILYRP